MHTACLLLHPLLLGGSMEASSVRLPLEKLDLDVDTIMAWQCQYTFECELPRRFPEPHLMERLGTFIQELANQLPGTRVRKGQSGFRVYDHVRRPITRRRGREVLPSRTRVPSQPRNLCQCLPCIAHNPSPYHMILAEVAESRNLSFDISSNHKKS